MGYKKTLRLLFVAAITLIGLNLAPAFAATPGTWVGIAEFGTFDLEVNAQGTGIEKITYHFSSFSCGGVIISGGLGITPGTASTLLKIQNKLPYPAHLRRPHTPLAPGGRCSTASNARVPGKRPGVGAATTPK